MNKTRLWLTLLLPLWDFLLLLAAFLAAYSLRLEIAFAPGAYIIPFGSFLKIAVVTSAGGVLILSFFGLYREGHFTSSFEFFGRLLAGVSVSVALGIILLFLLRDTFFSRLVIIYLWAFALLFLSLGHFIFSGLVAALAKWGIGQERTVLLGNNSKLIAEVAAYFNLHPGLGVKIIGYLSTSKALPDLELPFLGGCSELGQILREHQVEQLILLDELPTREVLELLWVARAAKVRFRYLPSLLTLPAAGRAIVEAAGYPVVELLATRLTGWGRILKRAFDLIVSLLLLLLLAPLFLIIAILIKLDSKGPVFYKSKRVGLDRLFEMYKFRTMYAHLSVGEGYGGKKAEEFLEKLRQQNEASGVLFKIKEDPRVTKIGRWLRKTSLDELPQLLNVFKGEMSLVGPRPPFPEEVERYEKEYFRRLLVKPGMTGLWQVSGRVDLPFEEYIRLDIHYVEHWSFWLDLWILLKTIGVVLGRKGGY